MQADRYIPVHLDELVEELGRTLFAGGAEGERFRTFAWLVENQVEYEHGEVEERLKRRYFHFSPDDDALTRRNPSEEERERMKAAFLDELDALLDRANFSRVPPADFERALREGTTEGLRILVDLEDYEEFRIYYRGLAETSQRHRSLRTLYRWRTRTRAVYRRAATVIKLRAESCIYIKLFKDIPVQDIEALLPRSRVKMMLLDKMKIGGTTGAAVFTAVRTALKGVMLFGKAFLVPVVLGVAGLYLGKTLLSFFQLRDRYRTRIIRDLFYQNLDNNLGVINRLVDSAEEEDASEAVLAYAFALAAPSPPTAEELKARVEGFLAERWDASVDFEVMDALEKLAARGLVAAREGRYEALPLAEAVALLDRRWDEVFSPPAEGDGAGAPA